MAKKETLIIQVNGKTYEVGPDDDETLNLGDVHGDIHITAK